MINRSAFTEKLRSGTPIFGIWMSIPHSMVAETLAQSDADFILMDGEHAPIPPDALSQLLPSTDLHGMPVIYRVRWNTPELIKGALDHGVTGLMVPMINSGQEAKAAIASAKYPPFGKRGIGAWRASNYYLDEAGYRAAADRTTPVILQIETREALDALDIIAATAGLDALYVGPGDLALSLGIPPGELHPDLLAACARVVDTARQNGLVAGIDLVSLDHARTFVDMGFSLFTYGADTSFVIGGGREAARDIRAVFAGAGR